MLRTARPSPTAVSPGLGPVARRVVSTTYRAVMSVRPVREAMAPWTRGHAEIDAFSPDGRGLGPEVALAKAAQLKPLRGGTALVVGVGAGAETELLLPCGIEHIIGADLEAHRSKWPLRRADLARQGAQAAFSLMDGGRLGVRGDALDLVFSHGVLEHVLDLDGVLAEAQRVLRPEGCFVAWFGPIWPSFGGPHVAGLAYHHLLLDHDELLQQARRCGDGDERWLERGLLNRLRLADYLAAIERYFEIGWVGVAGSREGTRFRDDHPDVWERLLDRYSEFDLLAGLAGVVAYPRPSIVSCDAEPLEIVT